MASNLKVGYARVNITPPMGVHVSGYYKERIADGVLDELEACAVAVGSGDSKALLMTVDLCGLPNVFISEWSENISNATGLPKEAVFIHTTHTHTGPLLYKNHSNPMTAKFEALITTRIVDVARFALEDMKDAKMGIGVGEAKNIAFIRRYRMKDGTTQTNPGVNNPDIVAPIGITDESVSVVRFDREGRDSVVIVNFACHPDVVGGNKISADWPGMTRRFVEKAIDGTKCIFFNGAEGDVNHVNVHPTKGDFNDMFNDFDGCSRGYGHARHMARVVTGAVLSVYDKVEYLEEDEVKFAQSIIEISSNKPSPEDLPLAHKYNDLHNAGRDDLIPFKGMMLTTVVAEAATMVRLENAPDVFPLRFSTVSIGKVALFGIPGEPFNGVGRGLKEAEGWRMVIPCSLTNGSDGYFPMIDSYDEGGYEARHSNFKAGVAEKIISEGKKILNSMK